MRFGWSWVLSLSLAATVVACSGAFGAGQGADAGGDDATDENPQVMGMGGADSSAGHDGTTGDAGHHDATAAAETGTTEGGGEGGTVAEAGDEGPPPGCGTGDIECSGACVPSDVHNCGTCGHDCTNLAHVAGATSCTAAGACSFPATACATGWADCNGKPDDGCETDITKPGTCGSCTNVCTANAPVCAGGMCVSGCPVGAPKLCSGTCVDTTSNANDCNGCGLACPNSVPNSQPTCVSSACTFTCNGNFSGCPVGAPTACVDEVHDANNCGGCNKTCPGPTSGTGSPACVASACSLNCSAGLTACPVVGPTECANTTTDLSNCGSCGDVCTTAVQNATPTCITSQCGFACKTGFLLCNSSTCIPAADTVNGAFVSPGGSGSTCSATQPCATIGAAIATGKPIVYLDKGTYTEQVILPNAALTVHGGWTFSGGTWTNCGGTNATSILSAPAGLTSTVTTSSSNTWAFDAVTIENNTTASAGQSLYGVLLSSGGLTLTDVAIEAAAGGAGGNGGPGAQGAAPYATCSVNGTSNAGANGAVGLLGSAGQMGTYAATGYVLMPGTSGAVATGGYNGGPGGTNSHASCGYAADHDGCGGSSTVTSGAGTPGCGGGPGGGGAPGAGGGASIGVFAGGTASITLSAVTVQTGGGGRGGQGGTGGLGVSGSTGAVGSMAQYDINCANTPPGCHPGGAPPCGCAGTPVPLAGGAAGGPGGAGGNGGAGGGGTGGDSLCYATGGGQVAGLPSCLAGVGGTGGLDGTGGSAAQGATGRSGTHN